MPDAPTRTVAGTVTVPTAPVRGSRFVGHLAPAADPAAAAAVQAVRRAADPDASHHCAAWRLGDGRERADDDGEPRDTGGAPLLRHLAGAGLVDVVCVVTRWFGGTKLGRGGLVRAYGDAAAAAIAAAEVVVHVPAVTLRVTHGYDDTGAVEGALHAASATDLAQAYGTRVVRTVRVPRAAGAALVAALRDATADRAQVERQDPAVG